MDSIDAITWWKSKEINLSHQWGFKSYRQLSHDTIRSVPWNWDSKNWESGNWIEKVVKKMDFTDAFTWWKSQETDLSQWGFKSYGHCHMTLRSVPWNWAPINWESGKCRIENMKKVNSADAITWLERLRYISYSVGYKSYSNFSHGIRKWDKKLRSTEVKSPENRNG